MDFPQTITTDCLVWVNVVSRAINSVPFSWYPDNCVPHLHTWGQPRTPWQHCSCPCSSSIWPRAPNRRRLLASPPWSPPWGSTTSPRSSPRKCREGHPLNPGPANSMNIFFTGKVLFFFKNQFTIRKRGLHLRGLGWSSKLHHCFAMGFWASHLTSPYR